MQHMYEKRARVLIVPCILFLEFWLQHFLKFKFWEGVSWPTHWDPSLGCKPTEQGREGGYTITGLGPTDA